MNVWQKHGQPENCFLLPHEVFELGLERGALLVYLYLIYCKYQKHGVDKLSCAAVGKAVGLCEKTVRRHLRTLVNEGLIQITGHGSSFSCLLCPLWDKVQERRSKDPSSVREEDRSA